MDSTLASAPRAGVGQGAGPRALRGTGAAVGTPLDRPGPRLDSLTALRWFAAFGVFLSHIAIMLPIPRTSDLFLLGTTGVTFFFILSGFVLTWTFFKADTAPRYYWRRFARIWPLLALTTVAATVLLLSGLLWDLPNSSGLGWWLLATLLLVHAWFPSSFQADTVPNTVAWSLSCEAFFYACFPLLVRPILRLTMRSLAILGVALVAVSWLTRVWLWLAHPELNLQTWFTSDLYYFVTFSPIARISEFVLGIVLAAAIGRGWRPRIGLRVAGMVALAYIGGVWLWAALGVWPIWVPELANRGSIPVFALLIAAAATADLNGGWAGLRSRVLVALGQWSYAFYLVHFMVLFVIARLAFDHNSLYVFPEPALKFLPYAIAGLVISVVISWLLYRFYEHPLERWLRGLLRRPAHASAPPRDSRPPTTPDPDRIGPARAGRE